MKKQTVLDGRYELGKPLGQGGMATVRMATDLRLGRTVAVKLLRTDRLADPTFLERFRREARAAGSLNHASIVAVYDTGSAEDAGDGVPAPYIVMEYVEGRTVRSLLRAQRLMAPERALEITAGVLSALEHSHQAGIVHRDIKPGNVMLTPAGDVKVMDFGIARALDSGQTITKTSAMIGTAQYISPEQVRGAAVDIRSDLYSTGCLLYEMLTGRPPFMGDSPISVAYQHVREMPVVASSINPAVAPEVDAIVGRALQKNPRDRYQSAAEMRRDVLLVLDGVSLQAGLYAGPENVLSLPPEPEGAEGSQALEVLDAGLPAERTLVEADAWEGSGLGPGPGAGSGSGPGSGSGDELDEASSSRWSGMSRRRKLIYAGVAALVLLVVGGAGTLFAVLLGAGGPGPSAESPLKPESSTSKSNPPSATRDSPSPTPTDSARVVGDNDEDDGDSRERPSPTTTPSQRPTPTEEPSPTPTKPSPEPTEPEPTEPEPTESEPTDPPPSETPDPDPEPPVTTPPAQPASVYFA